MWDFAVKCGFLVLEIEIEPSDKFTIDLARYDP